MIDAKQEIENAQNLVMLEAIKAKYLGKKGLLTEQLKSLSQLPIEERKTAGAKLNIIKQEIEELLKNKQAQLNKIDIDAKLQQTSIDVTLPGRRVGVGGLHPVSRTLERVEAFFKQYGFISADGPEIEDDFHNFTALNFSEHHPARASHDTFYFPNGLLLRTHTSNVQIRVMKENKPPLRVIATGRVYRCDSDLTHTPMFHQLEGLVIDENANFVDLKSLLKEFFAFFFEQDLPVRFRPSYFPFTEPSAEVDIGCVSCQQKGCRLCKNTGWLEVLGCGMVHPNVLKNVGIDSDKFQGFAFGVGLDRLTMLRYQIPDLRMMFENDVKFLQQFVG